MKEFYVDNIDELSVDDVMLKIDKTIMKNRQPINHKFYSVEDMVTYYMEMLSLVIAINYLTEVKGKLNISTKDLNKFFINNNYNLDKIETLDSKKTNFEYVKQVKMLRHFVDSFKERDFLKEMTRMNIKEDLEKAV